MYDKTPTHLLEEHEELMRVDLQESFQRSHIDPSCLSTFQRILLTTDGTVTHILEAYLFEQIQVIKLSEKSIELKQDVPAMELTKGAEVVNRKVLLRGRISRRNFIYAESILVPDRLDPSFRDNLLNTKVPIGRLWFERRVPTFKEIVDSGKEPANVLANYFDIAPEDSMLFRTYCVASGQKPNMMITEKFPESYFVKDF